MNHIVHEKIEEIADSIFLKCQNDLKQKQSKTLGLYSGNVGILLFLGYYYYFSGEAKYHKLLDDYLEQCFDYLSQGMNNHTYCNGVSGILYVLHHLKQYNFVNIDILEAEFYLDKWLFSKLQEDILNARYDFMHGALGIGLYYLKRGILEKKEELTLLLEFLENTSIKTQEGIKWCSSFNPKNEIGDNISLSHGMSSIGIFLCRFHNTGVYQKRIETLLSEANYYLLSQEIDKKKYGSFFPSMSKQTIDKYGGSRLAWCYGDLGIALELWQSGKAINNSAWKDKALEVLNYSTHRRDLDNTRLIDACVCHGTAGVAQIFRRMYYETGDTCFLETNEHWIQETLKQACFKNELAGFKYYESQKQWKESYSILDGIAGIGLVLIASSGDKFLSNWDEILLLSS